MDFFLCVFITRLTTIRIDKYLWAVRIYKTRSLATESCRKGHVSIGNLPVKPSREVHIGEVVKVRKSPVVRSFKVLALAEKRMSAKLTEDFLEDVTPAEELELQEMHKNMRPLAPLILIAITILLSGLSMTMLEGETSPSSGAEHIISHFWDFLSHIRGIPKDFHGSDENPPFQISQPPSGTPSAPSSPN